MRSSSLSSIAFGNTFLRRHWLSAALAVSAFLIGQLVAQQAVQRDQQAIDLLSQVLTAEGGSSVLLSINDFSETGTITYYWTDQVSGDVTVKGRGVHQLRIDASLSNGVRTVALSHGSGFAREADGTVELMPHFSAERLRGMTFPYSFVLGALSDSSLSVRYMDLVSHGGNQVYKIRLQKVFATGDPMGVESKRSIRDLFIEPTSLQIVGIRALMGVSSDERAVATHEIVYSDYQTINGIAVPLSIKETVRGQVLLAMEFKQIAFNTGLTDTTFAP